MKIWDIGGQFQYRQNWIDYAKNGDVIIFMVDSSNVSAHSSLTMYICMYSTKQFQLQRRNYKIYLKERALKVNHY